MKINKRYVESYLSNINGVMSIISLCIFIFCFVMMFHSGIKYLFPTLVNLLAVLLNASSAHFKVVKNEEFS